MTFVSGYNCFMDSSVRTCQKHGMASGDNFWRTGSLGPWIVAPDEVDAGGMRLETFVNGQEHQSSNAGRMIFDIPAPIAYCSTSTWLRPGDVVATGTPGGVGSRMTPPSWPKPGGQVEVKIGVLGLLANPVHNEA